MTWQQRYAVWWWRTACRNVLKADRFRRALAGEPMSVDDQARSAAALERLAEAGAALEKISQMEEMLAQCEALWIVLVERLRHTEEADAPRLVVPPKWESFKH